ncbi:MAG: carbohydrate kinase [Candidatus Omnitrophota bacterium]|nr:carbohydrate kinase [Candidatus Omnitrophota bacterium]
MKKKVICCGETLFDIIAEKGKTRESVALHAYPGGSATNTAIILARLGMPASLISHLGTGFMSAYMLEILKKQGVETKHIMRDRDFSTPLAFAHIDKKGNSSYLFYEKSVHPDKVKTHLSGPAFRSAAIFHTGSYFSYSDTFFRFVQEMLKFAKKNGAFITYDPNWREAKIPKKRQARERIKKIFRSVDLLKLSDTDAMNVTGSRTLESALKKIGRHLKGDLVLTLGEKGAFYWDGNERTAHPAFKVRVADTIGAGDGFTAGLIYRYYTAGKEKFKREKRENLEFASAVSALICSGHGATGTLRSLRQVMRFLRSRGTNPASHSSGPVMNHGL